MPKPKLQYFGHLMRRANSLEKTLMLGNIEDRKSTRLNSSFFLDITQGHTQEIPINIHQYTSLERIPEAPAILITVPLAYSKTSFLSDLIIFK